MDAKIPIRFKKPLKKRFFTLRIVKLFYLTLRYVEFRKMAVKARKTFGLYESNYLLLLEGRLASVVYRSIFLSNMFEILNFIKQNLVSINKVYVPQPNYLVKLFDLISFHSSIIG